LKKYWITRQQVMLKKYFTSSRIFGNWKPIDILVFVAINMIIAGVVWTPGLKTAVESIKEKENKNQAPINDTNDIFIKEKDTFK
jgi:hypothetical protein